jgi:hypothetical protein
MDDIDRGGYPSTSTLAKQGFTAVACGAGGVLLFALQAIARFRVLGLAAGAAACVLGIISLSSKEAADRKSGALITAAGGLVILSKTGIFPLNSMAGSLLGIGAFGLLAMGIVNGVRFFRGLKKRS